MHKIHFVVQKIQIVLFKIQIVVQKVHSVSKKVSVRITEKYVLSLISIMYRDDRYLVIKDLLETNRITDFTQIFTSLPKSILARDLRKNPGRMDDLIEHPEELSYREIKKISDLIGVSCSEVLRLIDKDFS